MRVPRPMPDDAPALGLIVARALHLWTVATMFGGAGLLLLLHRPVPRATLHVLRSATLVAAISGVAWFVLVFIDVTGDVRSLRDPEIMGAFMGASFGPPWALRLLLLAGACALGFVRRPLISGLFGLCLVLDQAWLGHAATGGLGQLVVDWVHVLAGFAWVGALVMLCILGIAEGGLPADALALFSTFGIAGVTTILASGAINASFRLRAASDLVETRYGEILGLKLVLFAGMIVLAAFNRRGARRGVAASVALETGLGLAVLAVVALLGVSAPPG